ncbi:hypothetical protein [Chryseobacterium herbae]|uniref:Uncharacterized protein n=1 Tax=Chryseobacterium herbae TaxID=2976476 RepID=A0ABT2IZ92_9FLAO|nr:hypothetical protein [Chryseobacterium sp. pc1-10]MCT2563945.1 hypothetical protein [Chryseobacterium sp. pc1-10]
MTKDLQTAFAKLGKRSVDTFPAEVVSVDKVNGVCKVSDGQLEYDEVQLSATVEENGKRFYLFPKIGSYVLVSPINEDLHRLYVEFFSEIEDFDLKIGVTELQIDSEGFLLKKENETLKELMSDLIKACKNLKFQTNTGVTIKLLNLQDFIIVENRFNQFLK